MLINIPIPATASIFFAQIMNLITFQLFNIDTFFASFLNTDDVNPIND